MVPRRVSVLAEMSIYTGVSISAQTSTLIKASTWAEASFRPEASLCDEASIWASIGAEARTAQNTLPKPLSGTTLYTFLCTGQPWNKPASRTLRKSAPARS